MKEETDVEEQLSPARAPLQLHRNVTLLLPVDADKVEATHENGVLLRLPKTEAVKPKKISVKKMITGN